MADWIFDPKPDITAHEVALLLIGLQPGKRILAYEEALPGMPKELRRHFRDEMWRTADEIELKDADLDQDSGEWGKG